MHIFIDESGDLGHKNLYLPGRSPFFVVTGICTPCPSSIAKCVAKVRDSLQGRDIKELKFTDSKPATRRRMLEHLATANFAGHVIVVDKRTVFPTLMDKKEIYFNWVSGYLIQHILRTHAAEDVLDITIDKRSFGKTREEFDKYIKLKLRETLQKPVEVKITHENSQRELCLQACDFIAGAVHRRYRYTDASLFDVVRNKLDIEEKHSPILKNSDAT